MIRSRAVHDSEAESLLSKDNGSSNKSSGVGADKERPTRVMPLTTVAFLLLLVIVPASFVVFRMQQNIAVYEEALEIQKYQITQLMDSTEHFKTQLGQVTSTLKDEVLKARTNLSNESKKLKASLTARDQAKATAKTAEEGNKKQQKELKKQQKELATAQATILELEKRAADLEANQKSAKESKKETEQMSNRLEEKEAELKTLKQNLNEMRVAMEKNDKKNSSGLVSQFLGFFNEDVSSGSVAADSGPDSAAAVQNKNADADNVPNDPKGNNASSDDN